MRHTLHRWSTSPMTQYQLLTSPSDTQWDSRHLEWNKIWLLKEKDRGLHLPMPAELMHLPLWREEGKDVGSWRIKEPSIRNE